MRRFSVPERVKQIYQKLWAKGFGETPKPEPKSLSPGKQPTYLAENEATSSNDLNSRRRLIAKATLGFLTSTFGLLWTPVSRAAGPGKISVSNLSLTPAKPVAGKITRINAVVQTNGSGRINVPWSL